MKKAFYLLSIIMLSSCAKEEKQYAEITLNLDNTPFIVVKNPLDDVYIRDMKNDTIYPNENNEFLFRKEISKPEYVSVKIGKEGLKSILFPNSKIEIAYIDSAFVFKGKNEKGMHLFNAFKRPYFDVNESRNYISDTTSYLITQKIKTQKSAELSKLQNLIDSTQIEERFAEILEDEINYFYALKTQDIILDKQYGNSSINEELLELFNKTIENYPLENDYKTSRWLDYADNILLNMPKFKIMAEGSITRDSTQKWYKNDKLYPFKYDIIKTYKNPVITEKVLANFIINASKQRNFESSLVTLYKDFKSRYPNSVYTSYLDTEIKVIEDYYQKISGEMPSSVKFIEGENIFKLEDLLSQLKGEKYYIDIWATWCGPCKGEFKYNNQLNALLKSKGYKKLYISLDKADFEDKWKQGIKYYDLNGLHMLANNDFFSHFAMNHSTYKGGVSIPQYLIVDEKGAIVTNNAPRPSELEALEKVLN
ncbi:TlpA family protein disulfide reductase [Lacinutrix undariae]